MLSDYLSQACGKEYLQIRSLPAIIPPSSQPSQSPESSAPACMTEDSEVDFGLDAHHPVMVEV